jgi:hypothetical protein
MIILKVGVRVSVGVQCCIKCFIFWDHKANKNIFCKQTLGILCFYLNLIITKQDSVYSMHHFIRYEIKIDVFQHGYRINILLKDF